MSQQGKVLCPVDFSEGSTTAMHYAANLSKRLGAKLTLLHCFDAPAYAATPSGEGSLAKASVEESLRRLGASLEEQLQAAVRTLDAGSAIQTLCREGDAVGTILDVSEELDVEMIVMGTHGRTGLARLLVGSVIDRVMRQAHCPVLSVPVPQKT